MPYADLNGAKIHFTDTGGDGDAIVFSHGLLMNGAMFDAQVTYFSQHYRCITFDHRGQGQSGVTAVGYDMDTLAEDAACLIRYLKLEPCHFVGLSMGGFVGMRLAARHPALLRSLTLLDTSAEAEPQENRLKYRLLNVVARWIGLWAVTGRVMPIMFGQTFLSDPARAEERKVWATSIASNHRIGITRAVSGVINREDCSALLDQISIPVGIGVGAEDLATKPEKSEYIHANLSISELTVFAGAGHSAAIETQGPVNNMISRTIKRAS